MNILRRQIDEEEATMKATRFILMLLAAGLLAAAAYAQPIPTNIWTDFGGSNCTVNAAPMPVGSIVQAFDPQGVLCGQRITTAAGVYVAMSVYGDDQFSPAVDEGCILNDVVTFKINGREASKLGPDGDLWLGLGPVQVMNLATTQSFALALSGGADDKGLAGTIVPYTVTLHNNGNGIDRIMVSLTSSLGWTVVSDANPAGFYLNPGATIAVNIEVHIPALATVGQEDELTVTASSLFDGATSTNKVITTTVDQQTDVNDAEFAIPGQFALEQNYPNPFNPETKISFVMEKGADVALEVYDILGRRVNSLHTGYLPAGTYEYTWYGTDTYGRQAASGIYFYRLITGDQSITRKMTLLK